MCTPHQASNIFKINTRWKNNAFYSCLKKTNSTTLPLPYLLRCSVVLLIFFGPFLHLVNLKKKIRKMHNFLNIDKSIIIVSISPLRNLREQTFCLTFGNSYSCFLSTGIFQCVELWTCRIL